nr:myeloid-derived growth factor isoform X2 [Peromyscus maniculatus bairdii]
MAAPRGASWAALLLAAGALTLAAAVSEPTTVPFDVRPGGVVHSFSQDVGPGGKFACTFTYASQGGTNEERLTYFLNVHGYFACIVSMYHVCAYCPWKPEDGHTAPGPGATNSWKLPSMADEPGHERRQSTLHLHHLEAPGQVLPLLHTVQGRGAGC